ncbi:hypothetical protein HK096_003479, partial [Nowakowskiella sp. JEL0078]
MEELESKLRQHLDQLEYNLPFSRESAPLVDRILADLILTTDSARKLKNLVDSLSTDKDALSAQIEPLRAEISRLTNENNQLHVEVVNMAEERDLRERKVQHSIRRHEAEMSDLRFMNTQYSNRIENEQRKVDAERKRVEDLITRQGGVIGSKDSLIDERGKNIKTEKIFQRLQKIEIETGLEPLKDKPKTQVPDPMFFDILKLSESRIEQLEKSNQDFKALNIDLENEIGIVRDQLKKREEEITRIGTQLEIARAQQFSSIPLGAPTLTSVKDRSNSDSTGIINLSSAKQRIEQLEMQIEYLQEHIFTLEKEQTKFDQEKESIVTKCEEETREAKEELKKEHERAMKMVQNLAKLENMVRDLEEPTIIKKSISKGMKPMSSEIRKVEIDLNNTNEKLRGTQSQFEKLQFTHQKLVNELKAAKIEISDLQKKLECSELGFDKDELLKLHSNSDSEVKRLTENLKQIEEIRNKTEENSRIELLAIKNKEYQEQIQQIHMLNSELTTKQIELDGLRTVAEKYKIARDTTNQKYQELLINFNGVHSERDDLLEALAKFEDNLEDVHNNIQIITSDRDNIARLYEQLSKESRNLRSQNVSNLPKGSISESATQSELIFTEIPKPDETAILRIQELESEVEKLQSDLNAVIMSHREAGSTANEAFRQLESETARLKDELEQMQKHKDFAEERVERMQKEINIFKDEINQHERTSNQLRKKVTQLEIEHDRDTYQGKDLSSKLMESESNTLRAR